MDKLLRRILILLTFDSYQWKNLAGWSRDDLPASHLWNSFLDRSAGWHLFRWLRHIVCSFWGASHIRQWKNLVLYDELLCLNLDKINSLLTAGIKYLIFLMHFSRAFHFFTLASVSSCKMLLSLFVLSFYGFGNYSIYYSLTSPCPACRRVLWGKTWRTWTECRLPESSRCSWPCGAEGLHVLWRQSWSWARTSTGKEFLYGRQMHEKIHQENPKESCETVIHVQSQDYQSWQTGLSDTPSSSCVCSCLGWVGTRFVSPSNQSKLQRCEWSWSLQRLWSETEWVHSFWFKIKKKKGWSKIQKTRDFSSNILKTIILKQLTPRRVSKMNSFTANSVTSNTAINSSWTGLVLPKTAPNEISTEPVQKSALIILR